MTERKTIRQLRDERGWSQLDLAVNLDVAPGSVSQWELGQAVPRPAMRQRLADLFGVPVEAIAFGPPEPASRSAE